MRNAQITRIQATARDHKGLLCTQIVVSDRGRTTGWVVRKCLNCY